MKGYNKRGNIPRRAYKGGKTRDSIWYNIVYSVGGLFICKPVLGIYT